jgi:hypothetical protein
MKFHVLFYGYTGISADNLSPPPFVPSDFDLMESLNVLSQHFKYHPLLQAFESPATIDVSVAVNRGWHVRIKASQSPNRELQPGW